MNDVICKIIRYYTLKYHKRDIFDMPLADDKLSMIIDFGENIVA